MIIETVDIIRDLVASLQLKIIVDSVTDNANGTYTIETCNTRHIQSGMSFSVSSVDYVVTSFVRDVSFTVRVLQRLPLQAFFCQPRSFGMALFWRQTRR